MKGFIIYAIGHNNYYKMAETLAVSLLFNNKECRIALICDDAWKCSNAQLFDKIIPVDLSQFMVKDKLVFNKATICMYDHSPYDVTIKLDADMIWLNGRDPLALFDELESYDVMHMNRGSGWHKGNSVWAREDDLKGAYGFTDEDKLYKIFGEFVYFKKCGEAKKYFKTVKQVFNKPKVRMDLVDGFANGTFTDELAYQIASMIHKLHFIENFTPVLNKYLGFDDLQFSFAYKLPDNFYAYSIGGNSTPLFMRNQYNTLAKHYYYQLGLQNPYQVKDKKLFLPERLKR